ncbi:ImmA/IrrE family metallo-endopeptidase [Brumimicrobium glaciale]|uniref:ImmA/IrrE family metallo-endopeptidase n=1 Tax=Brumimicrobium glaciale TaxID=200475 RepID=A0A4Q4KQR7_9FLAO|nr:ImmA/IrrE family metallo-endopeptidase [Brumimicrobium glaciale]RYM35876.1 ImmA/IrrE family metallo-endopeptidase [Brumimicrobium glaciale]
MNDLELKKSLLSCPGESIQEHIDYIGMSQAELAERLGRSIPKLNELIKGKAPITKETATKLEYVLDVPASFWLNLERTYQDELLEIEKMEHLVEYEEWVSSFPLSKMKSLGLIPKTANKAELASNLLKLFRVASPLQWSAIYYDSSLTFKPGLKHTTEPHAISVWLRYGELQAEKLTINTFDKKKLRSSFSKIQDIAFKHSATWLEELQDLSASFGLAIVYTPSISKTPIYGATRWIKNIRTPLIQLTDLKNDYNAFWFTFYHALGHVLYHGKKDFFLDGIESILPDYEKEEEADSFAYRMLMSDKERNELAKYPDFDKELILKLSKKFKKNPSIVVVQVQRKHNHLNKDSRLNSLKSKIRFKEELF